MNLKINKPYIVDNRLYSKIEYGKNVFDLYFEVEKEYSNYLCVENADAFLVSLIPFIVKHNCDVEIDSPISSKIYYQLTNYLLPILCKEFKKKPIKIDCKLGNFDFHSNGVGASVSLGVDSFYTLLKHKNTKDTQYNITHLTFFNAGSHGNYGGEDARKLFHKRLKTIKAFCEESNYKLVTVDTNMNEFIMMEHKKTHSFRTLGCVLALQKLFGKYYFASGYYYNEMKIDKEASAHYDTLNVQCLSNGNITFYSSGIEVSRIEKVNFISSFTETYRWLNVCIKTDSNCGECSKCIRTEAELDSIGMLDKYNCVFDVDKFKKKKISILRKIIADSRGKDCDAMYLREIIDSYKKNGYKIPFRAKILSYVPDKEKIKEITKKLLPKKVRLFIQKKRHPDMINDGWMD